MENNNNYKNMTASGIVTKGFGLLEKVVINSHTNGTIKLWDGLEGGVQASGKITSSGACVPGVHGYSVLTSSGAMVAGSHAVTVFTATQNFQEGVKASGYITSDNTNPSAGQAVVLGDITYTFGAFGSAATNGATACAVPLGLTAAETMTNLYNAMRYNTKVDVVKTSALVITATAKSVGTAGNSIVATENSTHLAWDDGSTLTGGVAADTITIGTKVYTPKAIPSAAYDFAIGATLTASLLNLKNAINGVSSYAGTVAHTQVIATASNATTVTLRGRVPGTSLNTVATTETCANASFPDATLGGGTGASDPGVTTDGAKITIDETVYTIVDELSENYGADAVAYQVKKGANEAAMIANLAKAINGTGTEGTEYSTGTVDHPSVACTASDATTLTITVKTVGDDAYTAVINAMVTEETLANTAWTGADIANGDQAQVSTKAATITVGDITYTAVTEFDENVGGVASPYQVLWETSEAVFLDNLKLAVNETGIAGTNYSTGTVQHPKVEATTNTNTEQTFQARDAGVSGNSIVTTTELANYAFGAGTLANGTGEDATPITGTITLASGPQTIDLNLSFSRGLYISFAATTVDATIVYQ